MDEKKTFKDQKVKHGSEEQILFSDGQRENDNLRQDFYGNINAGRLYLSKVEVSRKENVEVWCLVNIKFYCRCWAELFQIATVVENILWLNVETEVWIKSF